jgi:polyferredoxin
MDKVHRPRGLVRYDSFVGLGGGRTRWVRPRTIVYFILLLIGAAVATYAFSTVRPANFLVYRMSGAAYFVDRDDVRNQFMVRLTNKRTAPATFTVTPEGLPAGVQQTGLREPVTVGPLAESTTPLVLTVNRKDYAGPFHFTIRVEDAARTYQLSRAVEFMGPDPKLLQEEDREKGVTR